MTPNTLYPGQPDYVGPNSGFACWVHHEIPIEYCTNFARRIAYIRASKPAHEQAVRLAALTCLPLDRLPADLIQAWTAYDQAVTAYDQARTAYDQAWTAYDQAVTAYDQAWTAYDQAVTAYDQAWTAYRPLLLALMNELVPASLWNDQGLIFPQPGGQP